MKHVEKIIILIFQSRQRILIQYILNKYIKRDINNTFWTTENDFKFPTATELEKMYFNILSNN